MALFERLIFGGAYIRRGLSTAGNLRFKINWASLIVGSKFTAFALFSSVFEGNFPSTSSRGLYLEGRFNGGFFALPVWGAYFWRGLFSKFYGMRLLSVLWNSLRNDGFLKVRVISLDVLFCIFSIFFIKRGYF